MASHEAYIHQHLSKYRNQASTKKALLSTIQTFPDLRPKEDTFVFSDATKKSLLCLDGCIPIVYKGSPYNIPICIWLFENFPESAPMCYVKPTENMMIKASRHVDGTGKLYLPYLHEWKHPSYDLIGLIQVMTIIFGEESPLYSRPISSSQGFPSVNPEEKMNTKETAWEEERQRTLREMEYLRGELEKMTAMHADTVKKLEESQKMMLTFKSKCAQLEEELHRTKNNQDPQQEVERLKKELEDCKKQTCLGNEPVEGSTEGNSGDASSPAGMRESRSLEGFGRFQFHLSSYLTRDIIRDLTLVLDFSPTESEEAEDDKIKFIRLLKGKGLISPTDITKLTNALDEIGQHGVLNTVKNLFNSNPSEACR